MTWKLDYRELYARVREIASLKHVEESTRKRAAEVRAPSNAARKRWLIKPKACMLG